MGMEPVDYTTILADLEAKKAALEQTIASFRQALAIGALGQIAGESGAIPSLAVPSLTGGEVPTGAFLGKSIPEAARLYLEIVKKKQTTKEIMEGLRKGGIESTSKKFVNTVHAALTRARQSPNPVIVKVGTQWGLTGWFPKGVVSGVLTAKRPKKKKAAKAKAVTDTKHEAKSAPAITPISSALSSAASGGVKEQIASLLQSKPGTEFSGTEIATRFNLKPSVAYMLLGKLIGKQKAEKTPTGKYRGVGAIPEAKHAVV